MRQVIETSLLLKRHGFKKAQQQNRQAGLNWQKRGLKP
jgi:hypothetical protein